MGSKELPFLLMALQIWVSWEPRGEAGSEFIRRVFPSLPASQAGRADKRVLLLCPLNWFKIRM